MRYILVSLILLNLAYLYAHLQSATPSPVTGETVATSGDLPSITLLSESLQAPGVRRQQEMERVVNNPVLFNRHEASACQALGPFLSVTQGQAAVERLLAMDIEVQLRALDTVLEQYDYRVMIPPTRSIEAAFRKLRELQALGIDSYVITQGKDSMGISLGVFSSEDAAGQVRKKLNADGHVTEIRKMPRLERRYWVFSSESDNLNIGETAMRSIREQFPDVGYSMRVCLDHTQQLSEDPPLTGSGGHEQSV